MTNRLPREAVILAGGAGTRLRAVLADRPKPMAEVAGRPFLEWVLGQIGEWGVRVAVLSVGHMADRIQTHFGDRFAGIELRYAHEEKPLGTGGALRNAMDRTIEGQLLVLNGDSYCDIDGVSFWADHLETGAAATLAAVQVEDCSRYGVVTLDENGAVTGFASRPASGGGPGPINGGIYAFRRDIVAGIAAGRNVSLESEVLPTLVGAGLHGWPAGKVRFIDIGTPESLAGADAFFKTFKTRA